MEKFRIDNAYGAVYELNESEDAYVFCGKFHTFGITPYMTEDKQLKRIEEIYYQN